MIAKVYQVDPLICTGCGKRMSIVAEQGDSDPDAPAKQPSPARKQGEKPRLARPSGLAEELYRSEGVVLKMVADRSVFIEGSVAEVRNTAILGGLLAVAILVLFLGSTPDERAEA